MPFMTAATAIVFVVCAQLSTPGAAAAQERTRATARTDQTVAVNLGSRLVLENLSGTVMVRGWDKDAVRVQAQHGAGVRVSIRNVKFRVSVESEAQSGHPASVDYEINVPRWMPVSVDVTNNDITVEGTESDVSAKTVRGHVTIKGGMGIVKAASVGGRIAVEGARARVTASSVNDTVRLDDVVGDIAADTTNGAITLTRIQSTMVEATTVNGSITYDGSLGDDGHYTLATHNGDIVVAIPARSNVTFDVQTYNGRFIPELSVKGNPPARRGGHGVYTLGTGAAQMGLESFGGSIRVRDRGVAGR